MCLDVIFVQALEDQIGYKVFRKLNNKIHGCLHANPITGEHYPIKQWIADNNERTIWKPTDISITYKPGFHVYHKLSSAIKQLGIYEYTEKYCIFKIKYKQIVAIGTQDPTFCQNKQDGETVIVARKMMLLEEVKIDRT